MANLPTVEMVGPAGRRIVNESEVSMWRKKGYKLATEKPQPEAEEQSAEVEKVVDLTECSVPQLKDMAKAAGIEGCDTMRKAELIEVLKAKE